MNRTHLALALAAHVPADAAEAAHVASVLRLLRTEPAPFDRRSCAPGHVTASAFVVSPDGSSVLLIHHAKLGRWLQPGGHVDADDVDVLAAARREVAEETGLTDVHLVPGHPWLLDVDVHEIPAAPARGEPAHHHHDVRFAFRAPTWEVVAGSDALGARWVRLEEVATLPDTDASVRRAVARLLAWRSRVADAASAHAPATLRNREPLAEVLAEVLAPGAHVLEVASGTGEHAAWMAPRLGVASWQPTDRDPGALAAIEAHTQDVSGVRPPAVLDIGRPPWVTAGAGVDLVLAVNVVHISPWSTTEGLMAGAAGALRSGGHLVLYGPYRMGGAHTAPSNEAFDADLRRRDARWGVRDLEAVVGEAARRGLRWLRTVPLPANNVAVVFERPAGADDPRIDAVLTWWFGPGPTPTPERQKAWWSHDAAVDAEVRDRFGALHAEATTGGLARWTDTPRGRLALVIVLDQFSRHLGRDTAAMFAHDDAAQAVTMDGLDRGDDVGLTLYERQFLYMPLMHAETVARQHLSEVVFAQLAADAGAQGVEGFTGVQAFARRHAEIVERFGRFPHRNAQLGRTSTAEELAFLQEPGSSF